MVLESSSYPVRPLDNDRVCSCHPDPRLCPKLTLLQLPHLSLRLQAGFLPRNQLEIRDCRCHRPPYPWLRPFSRHLPPLPLMDIPAGYHLCALSVLLYPRPHQCSLQPLHTREVYTVEPFIYSRSRSLHRLERHIYRHGSPHFPEDPYRQSEGCDASIPFRLNGRYDAGIRASAAAVVASAPPAGGCKATTSGQQPIHIQN